jgi:hypothetical protein
MPTVKAEGIKLDELIEIKVSGGFYARLHQMIQEMASTMSAQDFQKEVQKVAEGKTDTTFSYHLETILVLVHEIETAAKEQGKISKQDVEVDAKV